MEYKNLGRTGLKVSRLSYGAWVSFGNQIGLQEAKSLLSCCREVGVNFFDNAEVYAEGKAEEIMGQAIKELGWKRSDVVISTKIFKGGKGPNDFGLSRKHLIEGTKASLKRLQMEYVDVLFCHRPDEETPLEETVRAMNFIIDQGWALYWGTSMWPKDRIVEAWEVANRLGLIGPQVEQPKYNLLARDKIFKGGKGPNDFGLSRKHLIEGTKASLKRLQMEYVDVLFCHRPDEETPLEETVRAMNFIIDQGWALYRGTNMWPKDRIVEAWEVASRLGLIGPQVEQPKYNLLARDKVEVELMPLYKDYGLGLTTYSPLASGLLSGKYSKDNIPPDSRFALKDYQHIKNNSLTDDKLQKIGELKSIATELGVTLSQLAIAWCAANPNVSTVLTGATKESQIKENVKAIEAIPLLTPEVMDKIEAVVKNKPLE